MNICLYVLDTLKSDKMSSKYVQIQFPNHQAQIEMSIIIQKYNRSSKFPQH